ncbi:MAG: Gldg family protein, partial [Alphaproteobacteria bacterium]
MLTYDGREAVVSAGSEEVLTGAIAKLVRRTPRVVYFVTGHRERGLVPGKDDGYGRIAGLLRDEGLEVRTLALLGAPGVPADASAVVVAGPEVELVEAELAKLGAWLDAGGAVLVLVDPVELPALAGWLAARGIRLRDDVVVDGSNRVYGSDGTSVVVPFWREHEATASLDVPAVLGRARSVALVSGREEDPDVGSTVLARTARESFAAAGAARTRAGEVVFREGSDEPGPVPVMAAAFVGPDRAR